MATYRIVDTDNFGGDYPNEKFIDGEFQTEKAAYRFADALNDESPLNGPRFYKVVTMPYELAPGFEL